MPELCFISPPTNAYLIAQAGKESFGEFSSTVSSQLGSFLPSLLGAIAILILGWLAAVIVSAIVRAALSKTDIDNRIASSVMGDRADADPPPIEKWIATAVFWIGMIFVLVAFLNALQLEVVSQPLNNFLQQIFSYLPKLGAAAVLLAVAWALATVAKLLLTRGLSRFRLDDRLAEQTGSGTGQQPFLVNETLGNVLYWFILLFFLPLVLDVLDLQGPLQPVQNLLDDILSALPKILTALVIGLIGWLVAKVVSGIVTNLLAAAGADRLGSRFGLNTTTAGGMSLSSLAGTVVYVLVLIPTAIAALNALQIEAISDPAISMLEQILTAIPNIFAAVLILGVFYVIGKFVSDLVTSLLTGFGFNNVLSWLGLQSAADRVSTAADRVSSTPPPSDIPPPPPSTTVGLSGEEPTTLQTTTDIQSSATQAAPKTPSEIVGVIVLVAIMLLGAIPAIEQLQFEVLTVIFQGVLALFGQVLVGVVIFAIGLYLANLSFNLISSSGGRQARILAQAARISIIAFVAAMALNQMGVATDIVGLAFGLLLGAIAVAIAVAFGLGGRDIASEQIREWLNSYKGNR